MNEAEFDQFADEYYAMHTDSIAASGEGPEYFAEYKIVDIAAEVSALSHKPTDPLDILDFDAGIGGSVAYVNKHLPNPTLTGLDPSQRSLSVAENRILRPRNILILTARQFHSKPIASTLPRDMRVSSHPPRRAYCPAQGTASKNDSPERQRVHL